MLAKIFTFRFNELIDSFDDAPLRDFIKDKEILSIREHFFMRHEIPYLTVIVSYNLRVEALPQTGKKRDESWRELIKPEDMPLFNTLRDWRSETSRRQGFPPYIICTNRQLAEIVNRKPVNKNQLGQIEGIGTGKINSYGDDMIALITGYVKSPTEKTDDNSKT